MAGIGSVGCPLFYFKFSISDPVANKRAVFKTFIGILAAFLLFMAIANYKMNFFAESRLLPVSLVLITSSAFMMALYFTNISSLLKIGGFMFFIAAGLSGYGNWLPQVEGGFPPRKRKKTSATCRRLSLLTRARRSSSAESGKTKFREPLAKGSARSVMHFTRGCWVSGLQILTGCRNGPVMNDGRRPVSQGKAG